MSSYTDINTIIFDADQTLFTVTPSIDFYYAKIFKEYKLSYQIDVLKTGIINTWSNLKKYYLNQQGEYLTFEGRETAFWYEFIRVIMINSVNYFDQEIADKIYYEFSKAYTRTLTTNLDKLLKALKDKDYTLGVFTNNDERTIMLINDLGISGYFSFVETSGKLGVKKPSVLAFEKLQKKFSLQPQKTLYVGNSLELDILPAQKAGWQAILFDQNKLDIYCLLNEKLRLS